MMGSSHWGALSLKEHLWNIFQTSGSLEYTVSFTIYHDYHVLLGIRSWKEDGGKGTGPGWLQAATTPVLQGAYRLGHG